MLFSRSVVSWVFGPHGLQHSGLLCPSLSPRGCWKWCPLSWWCHPTTLSSVAPFLSSPQIKVFSSESAPHIRWPKYWSFSFSPSNEYSGLISFRIDWFDLLAIQGAPKSLLRHHNSKASVVQPSPFFGLPCGSAGKESACSGGDLGLILGLGRSPGEEKGYPLRYSGLENSMDFIVHGVAKSWTWLRDFHFHNRLGQKRHHLVSETRS